MQDDVTEAVKWAIADGVADPKRMCIYGGSYGGYAALTGNPPEWFTEWGEGHGFFNEANQAEAYERMLAFFAKHLGQVTTAANN